MITSDPSQFLASYRQLKHLPEARPTMREAMLVTPEGFRISSESATDNVYMDTKLVIDHDLAFRQHAKVKETIERLGVPVKVFDGQEGMDDAVFPNNAFAIIPGKLIVGKMFHPVRQRETARQDIRDFFTKERGCKLEDLSGIEGTAELTGSLAIDRRRNIGFCGLSNRTDHTGAAAMHNAFGFQMTFEFALVPDEYHTNLILAILGGDACIIYPESFRDIECARAIVEAFGKNAVIIDREEKNQFVGNCLAITPKDLLFSQTAADHILEGTRRHLEKLGYNIHSVDVSELEKGGGSLRCLIAEIF